MPRTKPIKIFGYCRFPAKSKSGYGHGFVLEHRTEGVTVIRMTNGSITNRRTEVVFSHKGCGTKKKIREYRAMRFGMNACVPCDYCGVTMTFAKATVDHVKARIVGGPNVVGNFALACGPCNSRKGSRSVIAFLAELHGVDPDGTRVPSGSIEEPEYIDDVLYAASAPEP